jgi:hypothetical protein
MWRDLIGPLAEDHRVICPDLRGFGWTEGATGRLRPGSVRQRSREPARGARDRRPGRPRRARLGRLDRLHALAIPPRAGPKVPRAQHLPPVRRGIASRPRLGLEVLVSARDRRALDRPAGPGLRWAAQAAGPPVGRSASDSVGRRGIGRLPRPVSGAGPRRGERPPLPALCLRPHPGRAPRPLPGHEHGPAGPSSVWTEDKVLDSSPLYAPAGSLPSST